MKVTKIVYGQLEGDPAITLFYDDGQIWPFEKTDGLGWRRELKALTDGKVMTKEEFDENFPDAGMPTLPHQTEDGP